MDAALEKIRELQSGEPQAQQIEELRAQWGSLCEYWKLGAPQADKIEDLCVPGLGGDIPVRLFLPASSTKRPVVMFIHGGGWAYGTMEQDAYVQGVLCKEMGYAVASLEYRLAPENPFPAGLEDCKAVARWLRRHGDAFGIDAGQIVLGGASVGANLALSTTLSLRDEGTDFVAALILFFGVFGCNFCLPSYEEFADGRFGLSRDEMRNYFADYVPSYMAYSHPLVSPVFANLKGLPPTWLGAAELDVLRDDSIELAAALKTANVDNRLIVYRGLAHGFTTRARIVSKGVDAIRDAAGFLSENLL